MKIVVSVHELSTETQLVIDNMRRSKAPVLIGDPNKPTAVLLSVEEYDRLLREAQKSAASEPTQPVGATVEAPAVPKPSPAPQPVATAEIVPAAQHSDIAQRAAAAVQADRVRPAEPPIVSQRQNTLQPDAGPGTLRRVPESARAPRPTKPLPKPFRPLETQKPRLAFSLASIPGGWATVALALGMLVLGIVGFALIVSALNG